MSDAIVRLAAAFAGGAGLACLYLGALWASVHALPSRAHPGAAALAGAGARVVLVCAGFWLLSGGDGPRLAAALLGFVAARGLALALVRRPPPAASPASPRGSR